MQDFLSVADLSSAQLVRVLDLADELKADRASRHAAWSTHVRDELRGQSVALLFEKPSLRTRASFEVAVHELGGHPIPMFDFEVGLGKRETITDTGKVLSRYVHAIVIRSFGQERVEELAAASDVPVVNALTDLEHPCQALADLQTLRAASGGLAGRALAYVGDGNNVAHSLLLGGALVGMSVRVAHPEGYAPDPGVVERARKLAASSGGQIVVTTDPEEGVAGADAVYTDVWASMGQEAQASERRDHFRPYQVTSRLMGLAGHDAVFLHCLPAHRGEEVAEDVIDGPASRVFDQAENRLHAQKALLIEVTSQHPLDPRTVEEG
ncbi:MAG TPA: ornithine carbamoyltransferase [Nitriliruptorales bacterium]